MESRTEPATSNQLTACLRLARGSSAQSNWVLEDGPGGTTVTVGADESCDWQIRAPCVAPHALSVLLIGGSVFLASGSEGGVLLNGQPLQEGWQQVEGNARIDLGLARLELTWDERASAFGSLRSPAQGVRQHAVQTYPPPPPDLGTGRVDARGSAREREVEKSARAAATVEARGSARERGLAAQRRPARDSWPERLSRPSLIDTPTLLEPEANRTGGEQLLRYAGLGLLIALAYASWLTLLDRM